MAGISMKAVKNRIKSVENTMQITHAMELVSTSKLRKAKERAAVTKPVHEILTETIAALRNDRTAAQSKFFATRESEKCCYIVIGGDRGLAGGYNTNLFRTVREDSGSDIMAILPIGKKSLEHYKQSGKEIISSAYGLTSDIKTSDCFTVGKLICDAYTSDRFGRIKLAYTKFDSILTQVPVIEQILPFAERKSEEYSKELTIYEPSADELLEAVTVQYISALLYCAVCESIATEHAARRNSMSSANKNGEKMLEDMRLQYNRARQSVITQEITEIVAGAES